MSAPVWAARRASPRCRSWPTISQGPALIEDRHLAVREKGPIDGGIDGQSADGAIVLVFNCRDRAGVHRERGWQHCRFQLLVSDTRDEEPLCWASGLGSASAVMSCRYSTSRKALSTRQPSMTRGSKGAGRAVAISDLDVLDDLLRRHTTSEAGWESFRVAACVDHTTGGAAEQPAGQTVVAAADSSSNASLSETGGSCRSRFCSSLSSRWLPARSRKCRGGTQFRTCSSRSP